MKENKLEKLLNEDASARKFWSTLPESLQNKLGDNVDGFKLLKKSAELGENIDHIKDSDEDNYNNSIVSMHETTGLIPSIRTGLTPPSFFISRGE